MRHKNKENMDGIKFYETTSKKMLTFTVPRLYKQRKTTEQRSEKVTATSVRKAAGNQGIWFEKMDWQFLPDHEMTACDWGDVFRQCCLLGKLSLITILLL